MGWYNASWAHRALQTIDKDLVDEAVGFVPFFLSPMDSTFWDNVDASGDDLRFTTADGETEIPFHIVSIDTVGETGCVLVNVSSFISASADSHFFVYWGNGSATPYGVTDTYGRNNVFDANTAAFYLPGMATTDLTGNGYNLTAVNSPGTAASGIEGVTAADYDGSSQYHWHAGSPISAWPVTLESLVYFDDTVTNDLFGIRDSSNSNPLIILRTDGSSSVDALARGIGGSLSTAAATATYTTSTWYQVVGSRDAGSGTTYVYQNAGTPASNATTVHDTFTTDRISIGASLTSSATRHLNGRVALAAAHSVARSADWIATSNAAWTDPGFITGGASETLTAGETPWTHLTVAATSTPGDEDWTDAAQALMGIVSAAYADVPDGDTTYTLKLTDADGGLDEIIGSTPTGLYFEVIGVGEDAGARELYDEVVKLIVGGSIVGTNKASATIWSDTGLITRTYDFTSEIAALGLDDTDLTASNFGIALQFLSDGTETALMEIYQVRVKVDYSAGGGGDVNASGAVEFGNLIVSGESSTGHNAAGAVEFGNLIVSGNAVADVQGSGVVEFGNLIVSGESSTGHNAAGAVVFGGLIVSGTTAADVEASGAVVFDNLIVSGAGATGHNAAGAVEFGNLVVSGAGGTDSGDVNASGDVVFGNLRVSGGARADIEASGAVVFGNLIVTGVAAPPVIAAGAVVFGNLVVSGAAQADVEAGGAVEFGNLVVSGTAGGPGVDAFGAVVFGNLIVSGDGWADATAGITCDSLVWYLTGADADGLSQRDPSLSLGGYRSNRMVRSMTWDVRSPLPGIEILEVGGGNGQGVGSIDTVSEDSLTWTPPRGLAGAAVTILNGEEKVLYGFGGTNWIKVRRRSAIPLIGLCEVRCLDVFEGAIGFSNVPSADAISGETYYRAAIGLNTFDGPIVSTKVWLDAAASAGLAIAYEIPTGGALQTIADETTAPTGLTWNTGTTAETGLHIPPIVAGGTVGLWVRRTIGTDADPNPDILNHIHFQIADIVSSFNDALRGRYRIARDDYVTYGAWIGQDAEPDLSGEPDEAFTSLPHTTSQSLAGDHTYQVVIRQRNKWGLWSPNTQSTPIVLDGDGDQTFTPPSAPSEVAVTQTSDNKPKVSAQYFPALDGANRGEIYVVWLTADESTPDPADPATGYKVMGAQSGIEILSFTHDTALMDGTPVEVLVRARRLAIGAGEAFSPDTTQLPASGAGTIVVAQELSGWESSGYLKVTSFSGALQEVVEYSSLVVGSGISTFTVGSGGRGLWGTTAAATSTNTVIYPVTPVDSTNTETVSAIIDGIAPGRPWGDLIFGGTAAQAQAPVAGPDGATETYIDEPNNIYLLLGEGWAELWMDTVLVWKVFQDGNAAANNRLYIPSEWAVVLDDVSGAGTGVFESGGATDLYICAGSVRRVHIDSDAMTITVPDLSVIGGLPEAAPQSASWEQYAGSLLQSWDPEREDYRPYLQLTRAGLLTSAHAIDLTLAQSAVEAL